MASEKTVDSYLAKHTDWQQELNTLRKLVNEHKMKETIKWGAPVYESEGKNIVGLSAFKAYVGLWFFQGALLKDKAGKLMNAQEGKTHAMRQWRFSTLAEIEENADFIRAYIKEAMANQKAGKEIKPKVGKPLVVPAELQQQLDADSPLKEAFESLSLTKKREFAEHIAMAKREETKAARLEKIIPMIKDGIGLNDKYK